MEWLESIWSDFRYALRTFRRMPTFTAVAIITLALGIGATTAMFTLVNSILLRPLPYPESERIVRIIQSYPGKGLDTWGSIRMNIAMYRDRSTDFTAFAAYRGGSVTLQSPSGPQRAPDPARHGGFFRAIGVGPAHGSGIHRRRRFARQEHRHDPQRWDVAIALRRRPVHPRQDDRRRRAADPHRWCHARELRVPAAGCRRVPADGPRSDWRLRILQFRHRAPQARHHARARGAADDGDHVGLGCDSRTSASASVDPSKTHMKTIVGRCTRSFTGTQRASADRSVRRGGSDSAHRDGECRDAALRPRGGAAARDQAARGARREREARVCGSCSPRASRSRCSAQWSA